MEKKLLEMETVFKALADSTRLRILGLLLTGEVCVCHIHDSLKILQPKASRHLAYLRRARLVETRRDGLWVHYRLAVLPDAVLETIHRMVDRKVPVYGMNRGSVGFLMNSFSVDDLPGRLSRPGR